ncbi:hypothetical protein HWN40_10195 [Methanolobus zinderi]|jgi:hypothetical protein|uniref:Uncharacterized protein n=1 Tax=Methanolobus zinderi TaxID=536044 RepID=A0A7D5EFA4_9EURY|nr:hypothetical protein [Methanolobus zinderi]KXS41343.1 MAG: hypothetical protein AWU59_2158 [Methanolobus sp. T82-4]QLC50576.1 hypothetical protein HWN40_10195 [Methanolobus zinderi]
MQKALLIFALLVGMFLTIGCTDLEGEDEMEDDEEMDVEDEDLGIEESFATQGPDASQLSKVTVDEFT